MSNIIHCLALLLHLSSFSTFRCNGSRLSFRCLVIGMAHACRMSGDARVGSLSRRCWFRGTTGLGFRNGWGMCGVSVGRGCCRRCGGGFVFFCGLEWITLIIFFLLDLLLLSRLNMLPMLNEFWLAQNFTLHFFRYAGHFVTKSCFRMEVGT